MSGMTEFGRNVLVKAGGKKKLILQFDLSKELGASSSGASILVASANGILGSSGVRVGFNAYFKKDKSFNKKGLDMFESPENTENVEMELDGTILTLKCDLSGEGRDTSGGKSTMLATTRGNRKIGKSNIMVGLNVTAPCDKVDDVDITKLGGAAAAHNMKLKIEKNILKVIIDLSKESTLKASNGKNYLISSSKGGYQCPKPLDDLKVSLNLLHAGSKFGLSAETEPIPVNEKSKGVTYTVSDKQILTFHIDPTNDFGESGSGLSTCVGQVTGKMAGGASCNLAVYRRDPTKTATPKPKADNVSGTKRKAAVQYDKVKSAVRDFMDGTDEDLTVGTIRRSVCKKNGWDDEDHKVKSLVKAAIAECEDEDDEEDEEASDE